VKKCKYCGCETKELSDYDTTFITPVLLGGTRHYNSCVLIPKPSKEEAQKLQEDLQKMDEMRRRAEVESRNIWIG
jgi:hypothetical protein